MFDFSVDWVAASQGTGYKPSAQWKVPADYSSGYDWGLLGINFTYSTGKEVIPSGTGVMLSTLRGASLNGSVPGMMTLGAMTLNLTSNGNSTSSVTKNASAGVEFKNTPETFEWQIKPLSTSSISNWKMWLTISDGTNYKESNYTGNFSARNVWTPVSVPINYTGLNVVSKFNVMLSSCDQENAKQFGGSTIYESSVIYDQIHFGYNSELTAITVDGATATRNGNTFTHTVSANYIGVPALKFTGAVHDQMQTIEWLNNGEWIDGRLQAKVTNYGENSSDHTDYIVEILRPAVTSVDYTISFGSYTTTAGTNDTTFVNLPYGVTALPDINIEPTSIHQKFDITKEGKVVELTVTAEDGSTRHDVYVLRNRLSSDATLNSIVATGLTPAFAANVDTYTITADQLPAISFAKNTIGQNVQLKETADDVTLLVTAEDGQTTQTYTISLNRPVVTTNGKLSDIARDTESLGAEFSENTFSYRKTYSDNISFQKQFAQDVVVETINDEKVAIQLTGDASNTYEIVYPTEASSNADLADILLNGSHYEEFNPMVDNYTYNTNEPTRVEFILAESVQKMEISIKNGPSLAPVHQSAIRRAGNYQVTKTVFEVKITAEDGTTKTYTFTLSPETSPVATLEMIYINGTPLADFYPEKTAYSYVIPTGSPKTAEPALPEITYTLGQARQLVTVTPATALGGTAVISVEAEDGKTFKEYEVTITAEPSHCADLNNLLVNNEPINGFKPTRTNYSTQVKGDNIVIGYSSEDRFQTVNVSDSENGKLVTVTAQDATTIKEYEIEVWEIALSNNANLNNILLDNLSFTDYGTSHAIENMEPFSEKIYSYRIPLMGTTQLPDIAVQLQEDAQSVEILTEGSVKIVRVTAEDGTQNDYRLNFIIQKSSNTALNMIYLDGDELDEFNPSQTSYTVALPIGTRTLPVVDAIQQEETQEVAEPQVEGMQVTILVTAEDGTTANYTVNFVYTLSDADLLLNIYADGELIDGFTPQQFYYAYTLPMGVRQLPLLSYDQMDKWQTVTTDTITNGMQTTFQYFVKSESGKKNVYTIVYEIQKSDVDTLQMIYIDNKPLAGFEAQQTEYTYPLPIGSDKLPETYWLQGDDYQTVDTVSTGVNGNMRYIVKAENGTQRIYTVNFAVALSNNAALAGIYVSGKLLDNFDEDRLQYTVSLPYGIHDVPAVTYVKAEEKQNVTIEINDMTVLITVLAEDGITSLTYTVNFVESLSSEAHLAAITINGEPLLGFDPDLYEYGVVLPYGTTVLPEVGYVLQDETATATISVEENQVSIQIVSADEETMLEYTVIFTTELCAIDWLNDLRINGKTIEGFHRDSLQYNLTYPKNFDKRKLAKPQEITYEKADSTQMVTIGGENEMITIQVMAQNQTNVRVYVINQKILLNDNSLLRDISLNGITIRNFSDSVFTYEYLLFEGDLIPTVEAEPQDADADVDITVGNIGEDTYIYCTAQDGSESVYRIRFAYSDINTAQSVEKGDVLFKHIAGSDQYAAYTIRTGVSVVIYDFAGHRVETLNVPVCDPNSIYLVEDSNHNDLLYDVDSYADGALFTVPNTNQIYYYVFFDGKRKVASGKFMLTK